MTPSTRKLLTKVYQRIEIQAQGQKPVVTNKRLTWQGRRDPKEPSKANYMGYAENVQRTEPTNVKCGGTSKRSMEALNEHHHRNHNPQMCGVCGKMFELATTLAHHMYSHNVSKHHCDKCDFHCFFKSEFEAHKVVHRVQPSHKCMCGRWFKRKRRIIAARGDTQENLV